MMDVLPTLWSPRKTSLYFARGANDAVERALRDDDVRPLETLADDDGIEIVGMELDADSLIMIQLDLYWTLPQLLYSFKR